MDEMDMMEMMMEGKQNYFREEMQNIPKRWPQPQSSPFEFPNTSIALINQATQPFTPSI
jgi:hypothetical protein